MKAISWWVLSDDTKDTRSIKTGFEAIMDNHREAEFDGLAGFVNSVL